jgi:amino acid adenylation domain-containing protein
VSVMPTLIARSELPPEQEAIRAKCFHPTGKFVEFPREEIEQSIPERFEKVARQYPERLAISARDQSLTYDALNKAANRVAQAILAQRGTCPEPVGLLLEQSASAIVAILGVLKAGKFYVPLDPSHPNARIRYMLEDTQARLILTNSRNLRLSTELAQGECQWLEVEELDSNRTSEDIGLSLSPDRLACIIYTSGSTGKPKGVIHSHQYVLHMIRDFTNDVHICAGDRLSLLSSLSFSASVKDIFGALLNGAALLPFDLREEGLSHLAAWLISEDITICHSVPSVFRHFINGLTGDEEFRKLRVIRLGGEPVYKKDVDLYKKHFFRDAIFFNGMGATETGTICRCFFNKDSRITGDFVPAGYRVQDAEILLLDDDGREVELGSLGEIVVKSRYLSPGYWRKPDLTEGAFLPDPEAEGMRIYSTGDIGYVLPDGCLVHLGRKDSQVKIRGHRIEIAEIENALRSFDTIKEAVVAAREEKAGALSLTAFLVPDKHPAPAVSELRRDLAEKLPDYMIPSKFAFLEALPLTPTGKVDRRALPDPGKSRPDLAMRYAVPGTLVEEALAQIWAEVLSLDRVGIHDNFFDLGGHSLAATRVVSKVLKTFQLELPLQSLFESPTVAEMAIMITNHQGNKLGEEKLNRILTKLESLSEEEARRLLSDQGKTASTED